MLSKPVIKLVEPLLIKDQLGTSLRLILLGTKIRARAFEPEPRLAPSLEDTIIIKNLI